jgi:endo-1,4-beta-xylanase
VTLRCEGGRIGVRIGDGFDDGESPAEDAIRISQFDAVTDDAFLWSSTQPQPGHWNFSATDAEIAFAKAHHLYVTADHFIWDQLLYHTTPAWVNAINDPTQLRAAMLAQISVFTRRYGDAVDQWTVVNEPLQYVGNTASIQPNHFSEVLGPDWIADAFRIAHQGAPHASLWLNEIFTEDDPAKAHALVQLARSLVSAHVPIDGVSLEGHLFTPALQPMTVNLRLVHDTLSALSALGLKVGLSEIDDPTPPTLPGRFAKQGSDIAALVKTCLEVPRCASISFWDIDDSKSWLNSLFHDPNVDPTLFTAQMEPKPAFTSLVSLLEGLPHR